jgi:hypothetical protein
MGTSRTVTTLFVDVGNVLLTDSWGPAMRQKALEVFQFDVTDVAKRSQLTFEGYEEGNISLDDYLSWVVFHEDRPFTREWGFGYVIARGERIREDVWHKGESSGNTCQEFQLMRVFGTHRGLKTAADGVRAVSTTALGLHTPCRSDR